MSARQSQARLRSCVQPPRSGRQCVASSYRPPWPFESGPDFSDSISEPVLIRLARLVIQQQRPPAQEDPARERVLEDHRLGPKLGRRAVLQIVMAITLIILK